MMRRKEKEITDIVKIESILNEARVCRIAMCDGDTPYVVPVNFAYEKGEVYFHSAKTGRKIDILKKNNRVCFEIETREELLDAPLACNIGMKYLCVIGNGRAEVMEEPEGIRKALDILSRKHSKAASLEYSQSSLDRISVFKIQVENMSGKTSGF
jgi:nitroimidazol reductase NimA-like FMN-containing flavoprotein (pyridoxamine 5'-phosphate oxidase superfamily)